MWLHPTFATWHQLHVQQCPLRLMKYLVSAKGMDNEALSVESVLPIPSDVIPIQGVYKSSLRAMRITI